MKNVTFTTKAISFGVILLLFSGLFLNAQPNSSSTSSNVQWTKQMLQNLYSNILKEKGYIPTIENSGSLRFMREERSYFLQIRDDDSEYLSVLSGIGWSIDSSEERQKILEVCNEISGTTKVSKVFILEDNVILQGEVFISHPQEAQKIISRLLSSMDTVRNKFLQEMRAWNELKDKKE